MMKPSAKKRSTRFAIAVILFNVYVAAENQPNLRFTNHMPLCWIIRNTSMKLWNIYAIPLIDLCALRMSFDTSARMDEYHV